MTDSNTYLVKPPKNTLFKRSFVKAIFTSLSATSVDFIASLGFSVYFGIYYVTSNILGGICGAVTSFYLGRLWVFKKKNGSIRNQLLKFGFTNLVSIFLNSSLVFYIVETFKLDFPIAKVITAIIVGLFFNYIMNRYFVFKS